MNQFYEEALKEAQLAYLKNEVPVGCVVVSDDKIIGRGHNQMEILSDPSAHGEVLAIKEAAKTLGTWRLDGCILYVTLEPCLMCSALIRKARISHVIIGAIEPNEGAFGSVVSINDLPPRGRYINTTYLYDDRSSTLLTNFFKQIRREKQKKLT